MKRLLPVIAAILILAAAGCLNFLVKPSGTEIVFYLTDKPSVEAEHLYVLIEKIELIASDEASPVELTEESTVVDIIGAAGDLVELGATTTEATFTKIRLHIGAATVVTAAGTYECEIPSKKLDLLMPKYGAGKVDMIMDFDVNSSLLKTGETPPRYMLKPVIKVTCVDPVDRISIHGFVRDATGTGLAGYAVGLFEGTKAATDATLLALTVSHKENPKWQAGEFRIYTHRDGKEHAVAALEVHVESVGDKEKLVIDAVLDSTVVSLTDDVEVNFTVTK